MLQSQLRLLYDGPNSRICCAPPLPALGKKPAAPALHSLHRIVMGFVSAAATVGAFRNIIIGWQNFKLFGD